MAFYSHPAAPFQLYAYAPMPIPNHEFYAVYPPAAPAGVQPIDGAQFYYEHNPKGNYSHSGKHFNRKDSADSGISNMSRKTSTTSNTSCSSILEEPVEETIKEEVEFVEPDLELCKQITEKVEFIFSDVKIVTDKFLLKHIKRNKEGYVSLKLISSFKEVKRLTKDWKQVAFAIKQCSKKLEVNDLGTKVRRLDELPPFDETFPSRTVVVINLPMKRPTIEAVNNMFSMCDGILLIRIMRPDNPIPDNIKHFVNKHPEMATKMCALVEFEKPEHAQEAVMKMHNVEEEEGLKVIQLTPPPLKNGNKKIAASKLAEKVANMAKAAPQRKYSLQANYNAPTMSQVMGPRARRISLMPNMKFSPQFEDLKENVVPRKEYSLNPNAPSFQMNADGTFQMIPPMNQRRRSGNPNVYVDDGPQFMSMPSRRVSSQFHGGAEAAAAGLKLPANVVRMPKGPEGKGFNTWCKSRMGEPKEAAKRASKAIPIVAPPPQSMVTLAESPEEKAEEAGTSTDHLQVPSIHVEAASASEGSEDEAVVPDKTESCDSGHEDTCSEPDAHDYSPLGANERTR